MLRNLSSTHKDPSDGMPPQMTQDQDQIAQDKLRLLGSHPQNWSRGQWYSCGGYSVPPGGVRSPEDSNGCLTSGSPLDDYTSKKGNVN